MFSYLGGKKNCSISLRLLSLTAMSFVVAVPPSTEEAIKLSLSNPNDSSMTRTWVEANKLAPILNLPGLGALQGVDTSHYWSGASAFLFLNPDDATLLQVMFDVLMANPLEHYSIRTHPDSLVDKIYRQVTGNTIDQTTRQYIRNCLRNYTIQTPQSEIYHLFHDLHTLEIQAMSCNAYWETANQMGRTVPKVVVLDKNSSTIPTNISTCQKAICTTRKHEPFNAFYEISNKAGALHKTVEGLDCERTFQNSGLEKSLCMAAKKTLTFDTGTTDDLSTLSISDGHRYIRSLPGSVAEVSKILQPLVILQLAKEATTIRNQNPAYSIFMPISFKSIFTPVTQSPPCSAQQVNGKLLACSPEVPVSPDIDKMINEMFGMSGDFSAITPGLSIGLDDHPQFTTLVAGKFYPFEPISTFAGVPSTNLRSVKEEGDKKLFISKSTEEDIKTFRQSVIGTFHKKRNSIRTNVMQQLLAKSASIDISTSIKDQNHKKLRYIRSSGQVETRLSQQTLQESSVWRMDPKSGWLSAVAAMSNVSLRREIVVLLAEIKQLQYFIFMNNIQETILGLFINSMSSEGQNEFLDLLDEDVYQSVTGIPKSRPSSGKESAQKIDNALGDPFD